MAHFREYDPQKDRNAVHRIWKEVGWLEEGQETAADEFIDATRAFVADIDGEAECLVATVPGTIQYLEEDLPFSGVASVATSRIARKKGFAKRLTALAVARAVADGAFVSGLGMFEQGFYNQLGYGTGSYEHLASFDPSTLKVDIDARVPSRLTKNDWEKVHESRIHRKRSHGMCNLLPPQCTKVEMTWSKKAFGLGYFDDNGDLTHHMWFDAEKVENGPYQVNWIAYRTDQQFLELMALLRTLGDQVRLIRMCEPPNIQLQDLLEKPFKSQQLTEKSEYENRMQAIAFWQVRILDLCRCLKKTHLSGEEVSFNLELSDPLETVLDTDLPWQGISGCYIVVLGPDSSAEEGKDKTLPTLKASVGAFTRMWLGVCPASGLAVTDDLSGSEELLHDLDQILCIPEPHLDWEF